MAPITPPTASYDLKSDLAALGPQRRAELDRCGFDEARFLSLAATLRDGDPATRRDARNRISGDVTAPAEGEILRAAEPGSAEEARLAAIGDAALRRGELAFCVLAGGMATRMGGVVKALVEALPGKSFLDLRLAENRAASAQAGAAVPLWLMVSNATDGPTREALTKAGAPPHVQTFLQDVSLRLTPEGHLFRDGKGEPSVYSHGPRRHDRRSPALGALSQVRGWRREVRLDREPRQPRRHDRPKLSSASSSRTPAAPT